MMAAVRKLPLLVILGATGTGKSKLAIELAQRFNGEIISADSMQIYKGLNIITNKVTEEEQAQCNHHLIGYLDPFTPSNTVVEFRNLALPIIENLFHEAKMPVVVGGTNYYIEALLWDFLVNSKDIKQAKLSKNDEIEQTTFQVQQTTTPLAVNSYSGVEEMTQLQTTGTKDQECFLNSACINKNDIKNNSKIREGKFVDMETSDLYKKLMQVDPERAKRLHPHNRRRIIRALEVFETHGIPISHIHKAQHLGSEKPAISGPLRYPNTCILWIQCDHKVLCERLDSRVDRMVERGLLQELTNFHQAYKTTCTHQKPDYTLGIFQSIGFKEFHGYLMLADEEKESEKGRQLKDEGIAELKLVTRRYAKRQIQWIKSRFLGRPDENVPPVYSLNSTDINRWQEDVLSPAEEIVDTIIKGRQPCIAPLECSEALSDKPVYNVCHVCGDRVFVTQKQWESHIQSRKHKKLFGKKLKKEREKQEQTRLENDSIIPDDGDCDRTEKNVF